MLFEILTSMHTQAALAVEKEKILAEQRKVTQHDLNNVTKRLSALQDAQTLRERQGRELYEAFALGNISKSDYLAEKIALSIQNERAAAQIIELQSVINVSHDSPEDEFIEKFKGLGSAKEVTDEIVRELLKEVRVYPHGQLEIVWNYSDPLIHT